MRTTLTAEELHSYKRDGFLVIPDFLTAEEVDELEAAVLETIAASNAEQAASADIDALPANPYSQLVHYMNPFQTNARIRKFSTNPELAELTRTLEGAQRIRLYQDMIAVKHPWGGPTGFHMDVPRISFTSDQTVTYWFPLVDVDLQNGCLYYLPGRHLEKKAEHRDVYQMGELDKIGADWPSTEPKPAVCPRGGVVLHEGYAPHGTNGNMTPRARPVYVITQMPDGTTFDGTPNLIQPGEMPVGTPLDDESRFPLVLS